MAGSGILVALRKQIIAEKLNRIFRAVQGSSSHGRFDVRQHIFLEVLLGGQTVFRQGGGALHC